MSERCFIHPFPSYFNYSTNSIQPSVTSDINMGQMLSYDLLMQRYTCDNEMHPYIISQVLVDDSNINNLVLSGSGV